MAFNEFRQDSRDQSSLTLDLKARLNELGSNFGAYVQGSRLVIPLMDVKVAALSVALSPDKKRVVSLTLTF